MEDIRTFEKGMIPQVTQTKSPQGSYLDALNLMRDEAGTIMSEDGIKVSVDLGIGFEVVGHFVLNNQVVIAYTNDSECKIGIINTSDTLTEVISNTALGFKKGKHVSITGKLNSEGQRVIYLCGEGIPIRAINLDDIPTDFDDQTNIFYKYVLPKAKFNSLTLGGSVPTGIYQFTARLVAEDNSTTPFGPLSDLIPVGTGSLDGDSNEYTGAPPQTATNFRINLDLESVDKSFKFVEVAVITYLGTSNQPTINLLDRRPVDSLTDFSYTGTAEHNGVVLLEEIAVGGTFYTEAKHLIQKDNTLLLCGVKERSEDMDWRKVANSIEVGYVEKKILVDDTFNVDGTTGVDKGTIRTKDYRYPEMSKYVGYRRDEVYSFTFTPIFTGGRKGGAYHIPAQLNPAIANGLEAVFSTEDYPKDYPDISGKVRYHKFPDNTKSPTYITEGGRDYMVALGIHVKINYTDPNWSKTLIGYEIGRENRRGNETMLTQGIVKNTYKTPDTGSNITAVPGLGSMAINDMEVDFEPESSPIENICTFHSPDQVVNNELTATPTGMKLASVQSIVLGWKNGNQWRGYMGKSFFYTRPQKSDNILPTKTEVDLTGQVVYIPTGSKSPTDDPVENADKFITPMFGTNLVYKRVLSCLAVKATTEPPRVKQIIDFFWDVHGNDQSKYDTQLMSPNKATDRSLVLFNLTVERSKLYGSVYDKIGIPVSTVYKGISENALGYPTLPFTETIAFGGDTYLNRVAYTFRDTCQLNFAGSHQNTPNVNSMVYMVMESDNNFALRHTSTEDGSIPFYPVQKNLTSTQNHDGLLDLYASMNHASGYNKQYSAQNLLKTTVSKGIDEKDIVDFPNRIVYSNIAIEGEKADSYRIFLPNNYHDIPKHFGKLTGAFVLGNDLFFHTEESLWRSFYNSLTVQSTSSGDVVLGNGGAFSRPSVPVVSLEGGYAGCLNVEASIGSPLGRFFYDAKRCKLYLFTGQLKEISNPNLFSALRKLQNTAKSYTYYDYGRKRLLLHTSGKTVSYKPELNSFDSYHSYGFTGGAGLDTRDFLFNSNYVGKFSDELYGEYFTLKNVGYLKIASVVSLEYKRYRAMKVLMNSFTLDGVHKPFWCFDRARFSSYERNTGIHNLESIGNRYNDRLYEFGTLVVERAGGEFRFGIPSDAVIDMEKDIFDTNNLLEDDSPELQFLPDFMDNHAVAELWLDYNENVRSRVELIKIDFDYEQN